MKSFIQFLNESITVMNSTDLKHMFGGVRVVNKSTAKIDAKDVNKLRSKLDGWGYTKYPGSDKDTTTYKKGDAIVSITLDAEKIDATIVID